MSKKRISTIKRVKKVRKVNLSETDWELLYEHRLVGVELHGVYMSREQWNWIVLGLRDLARIRETGSSEPSMTEQNQMRNTNERMADLLEKLVLECPTLTAVR